VDNAGNAYVAGFTGSLDFPTTPGVFKTTFTGSANFVTKLSPLGDSLIYSTYLGSAVGFQTSGVNVPIAVDSAGEAYIAGGGARNDFPTTTNAFQTTCND
jgi:hypothetical protein